MNNNAFIITLAYPETIVKVSHEWIASNVYKLGIGKKNYVRAGHAAIILIEKSTGNMEYFDFGRYITPQFTGRMRSKLTDHELDILFKANIEKESIKNLDEILNYFASNPKLTHGTGSMIASVCDEINFQSAKSFIDKMHHRGFVKYAVFEKNASNCARFVTDLLIASVTNDVIKRKLSQSKWFTPSTIGNVILGNNQNQVYEITEQGEITMFKSSSQKINRKLFFDKLKQHTPNVVGTIKPQTNKVHHKDAQWIGGIGCGAWFEMYGMNNSEEYRFRRISPHGNIDVDGIYKICEYGFEIEDPYKFTYHSNCHFFHVSQNGKHYRFEFLRSLSN